VRPRKALVWLLGLVAVAVVVAPAHAAYPGLNGKIAFESHPQHDADIYLVNPDGSGQTEITGDEADESFPVWSPDGTKLAFAIGGYIWRMNADGSGRVNLTSDFTGGSFHPTWSPDGTKIAFVSNRVNDVGPKVYVMNAADGSGLTRLTDGFGISDSNPAWSPDGRYIAFYRINQPNGIYRMNTDGTGVTLMKNVGSSPAWSPSGHRIAYSKWGGSPETSGVHTMDPDGSNDVDLSSALTEAGAPEWSPDGTKLVMTRHSDVWTMNTDGSNPIQVTTAPSSNGKPNWQPLPYRGYPRPKGATPLRVPLVPAFATCSAPNRTHGPPLAFGSCSPPSQTSPNLTVGTPDANGAAANSSGSVQYAVLLGVPGPPDDSDVRVTAALSDVRCSAAGAACGPANAIGGDDYAGELLLNTSVRVTDAWNAVSAGGGSDRATMIDIPFPLPVGCAATSSTSTGGSCSLDTSMNAVVPATVKDGDRTVAQLGAVQVLDGGPDGDTATADNSVFAVQGLFVP
jgi:TolB protein